MLLKRQHQHLKVILSIGGGAGSQNFASIASSAVARDNFGRSAKGLVEASGFDGIDSKSLTYFPPPLFYVRGATINLPIL